MAKRGVKVIHGPSAPVIGRRATYHVIEWHPDTPESMKADVKWEVFLKGENGEYTTTGLIKTGWLTYFDFEEGSFNHDYLVECYLFSPELTGPSTINVIPIQGPASIIDISILDYQGNELIETSKYGQTVTISVNTVNMIGEELTISLWERDTYTGKGHYPEDNIKLWEGKTIVESLNGITRIQKRLTIDMAEMADNSAFEGGTHEYYAVVEAERLSNSEHSPQELEVSSDISDYDVNYIVQDVLNVQGVGADPIPENGNSPNTVGEQIEEQEEEENGCPRCKVVTSEELKILFENASDSDVSEIVEAYNEGAELFQIDTCEKKALFFAQVRQEVGASIDISEPEGLNYSARRLKDQDRVSTGTGWVQGNVETNEGGYYTSGPLKTGPFSYFKNNPDEADLYGRKDLYSYNDKGIQAANHEAIANRAYSNNYGNGSIASGDGNKYRGKGIMQLTWKENYTAVNQRLVAKGFNFDIVNNPNSLLDNREGVLSAMAYYYWKNLHLIEGQTEEVVNSITAVVNSNTTSYEERWEHFQTGLTAFKVNECQEGEVEETEEETNEFGLVQLTQQGNPNIINYGHEDTYSYEDVNGNTVVAAQHGDDWIKPEKAAAFSSAVTSLVTEYPGQQIHLNDCSAYNPEVNLGHSDTGAHSTGDGFDSKFLTANGNGTNNIYNLTDADKVINARFIELLIETGQFSTFYAHNGMIEGTTHADGHVDHLHGE